jgi:hypothetical protein
MFIKTLTLYSLTYIVGITSSIAVHQGSPRGAIADFQSDNRQIVVRSLKSGRLPVKQAEPHALNKAPVRVPAHTAPNLKVKDDCKPPIDVRGRCFANLRVEHEVA